MLNQLGCQWHIFSSKENGCPLLLFASFFGWAAFRYRGGKNTLTQKQKKTTPERISQFSQTKQQQHKHKLQQPQQTPQASSSRARPARRWPWRGTRTACSSTSACSPSAAACGRWQASLPGRSRVGGCIYGVGMKKGGGRQGAH